MGKRIARILITLVGLFVGPGIVILVFEILFRIGGDNAYDQLPLWLNLAIFVLSGIASGVLFLFICLLYTSPSPRD